MIIPPPSEIFVAPVGTASHTEPYNTWAKAATNIATAVTYANANQPYVQYVTVSNGTYNITASIDVSAAITIRSFGNGVTGGLDNAAATIVSRSGTGRVFLIDGVNTTVDGFRIQGGNGDFDDNGAGVKMTASGATVKNCIITGNSLSDRRGGGVYMSDGVVSNCTIYGNSVSHWNNADHGAGVYMDGGLLVACRIRDNTGIYNGGGVYLNNANATVRNCLITGNKAGRSDVDGNGGGVYMANGTVENCTIVTNTTEMTRVNSTAGGIYRFGGTVRNCIVYNNTSLSSWKNIRGDDSSSVTYTCTTDPTAGHASNISADPLFENPAQTNYTLQASSPCIDTGTNQTWMVGATDLAGNSRKLYGAKFGSKVSPIVDMGAYEAPEPQPTGTLFLLR